MQLKSRWSLSFLKKFGVCLAQTYNLYTSECDSFVQFKISQYNLTSKSMRQTCFQLVIYSRTPAAQYCSWSLIARHTFTFCVKKKLFWKWQYRKRLCICAPTRPPTMTLQCPWQRFGNCCHRQLEWKNEIPNMCLFACKLHLGLIKLMEYLIWIVSLRLI